MSNEDDQETILTVVGAISLILVLSLGGLLYRRHRRKRTLENAPDTEKVARKGSFDCSSVASLPQPPPPVAVKGEAADLQAANGSFLGNASFASISDPANLKRGASLVRSVAGSKRAQTYANTALTAAQLVPQVRGATIAYKVGRNATRRLRS